MSIKLVVTRGFGNGTYRGTIADVVTRGYNVGAAVEVEARRENVTFVHYRERRTFARRQDKES